MSSMDRFPGKDTQYREQIVEYRFLSDLILCLASKKRKLEILRVHSDSFGYDLVLKVGDTMKYVQLKSVIRGGKAAVWDVHKSLLRNDDGTVVLVLIDYKDQEPIFKYRVLDEDEKSSVLKRKPKHKSDSKKYCGISRGYLQDEVSIDGLVSALFPLSKN